MKNAKAQIVPMCETEKLRSLLQILLYFCVIYVKVIESFEDF